MNLRLTFIFYTLLLVLIVVPLQGRAAVIISEVLPDPSGSDSEYEFVELYNNGSETADLSGWKLDDVLGNTDGPKKLAAGTLIQPGQYLAFFASFTDISFNNATDSVNLLDPQGVVMDSTAYIGDDNGKVKENYSWALVNSSWQWVNPSTPNEPNSLTGSGQNPPPPPPSPTPSPTSQGEVNYFRGIFLHEILPSPEGDDSTLEFIELYNSNLYAIDLGSWKIDDASGGSAPYTIPANTTILALGYLAFYSEDTHIALTNSGDEARLFYPDGTSADSLSYTQSQQGLSYAKTDFGTWSWTSTPTPGKQNIITTASSAGTATTVQSTQTELGSTNSAPAEAAAGGQESSGTPSVQRTASSVQKIPQAQTPTLNPERSTLAASTVLQPPTSQIPATSSQQPATRLASVQQFPYQPNATNQPQRLLIDFKSAALISAALATVATILWKYKRVAPIDKRHSE